MDFAAELKRIEGLLKEQLELQRRQVELLSLQSGPGRKLHGGTAAQLTNIPVVPTLAYKHTARRPVVFSCIGMMDPLVVAPTGTHAHQFRIQTSSSTADPSRVDVYYGVEWETVLFKGDEIYIWSPGTPASLLNVVSWQAAPFITREGWRNS